VTAASFIGAAAFWLGTVACLPPTWRVWRRRSAGDYSWLGLAMSLACMTLMETYLVLLGNWLALGAQAVGYAACLVITVVKWATERHRVPSMSNGPVRGPAPVKKIREEAAMNNGMTPTEQAEEFLEATSGQPDDMWLSQTTGPDLRPVRLTLGTVRALVGQVRYDAVRIRTAQGVEEHLLARVRAMTAERDELRAGIGFIADQAATARERMAEGL